MSRARRFGWWVALAVGAAGVAQTPRALIDRTSAVPTKFEWAPPSRTASPQSPERVPDASLWVAAVFRADRASAGERYTPAAIDAAEARLAAEQATAELEAQRPAWSLAGVILGDPPLAILKGIQDGNGTERLVGIGDEVEGFFIETIRGDRITIERDGHRWTLITTAPWS